MLKYSWKVSMIILADVKSIFDCRVSSFLNNHSRESRSLVCQSQKNSSTTKAKHCLESLRISEQISNALTGFELQFVNCRNSPRVDSEVRIRNFSKGRNIDILVCPNSIIFSTTKPKMDWVSFPVEIRE